MTDLKTRWTASHERLEAATAARDEAYRASNPSRQQITRAEEAYQQAVAAHYLILDEQNAAMEAEFAAEDAAAVAEAMRILGGK
jgi:uncharacterized iron-regulated membrane protein